MEKYIFWDFNGTILDDAFLCYEILNEMLTEVERPKVTFKDYLMIFDFPVKDYYAKVYDLEKTDFTMLANRFIQLYQPRSLKAPLHKNIIEIISYFKAKGYKNIVLSASEKNNLIQQLKHFEIYDLFDDVLGTSDIYAAGKVAVALDYINNKHLDTKEAYMIGDTLHDAEVAYKLNIKPIIYTQGHQDKSRLKHLVTIDNLLELKTML